MINLMPLDASIFESRAEALVCPVNCVGVMGAGLALQFKRRYSQNYNQYRRDWANRLLKIGAVTVYEPLLRRPAYIINFPTKRHWRDPSEYRYIDAGLEALIEVVKEREIKHIAIPALGCGLGELQWYSVQLQIEAAFSVLPDVQVDLYSPRG